MKKNQDNKIIKETITKKTHKINKIKKLMNMDYIISKKNLTNNLIMKLVNIFAFFIIIIETKS